MSEESPIIFEEEKQNSISPTMKNKPASMVNKYKEYAIISGILIVIIASIYISIISLKERNRTQGSAKYLEAMSRGRK